MTLRLPNPLEHVTQTQVDPVFEWVGAVVLPIRLNHYLRMKMEAKSHGGDSFVVVEVGVVATRH